MLLSRLARRQSHIGLANLVQHEQYLPSYDNLETKADVPDRLRVLVRADPASGEPVTVSVLLSGPRKWDMRDLDVDSIDAYPRQINNRPSPSWGRA